MAAFCGWSLTTPFLRLAAAAFLLALLARAATSLDISSSQQLVAFSQEEFAMDTEIHRRVLAGRPVYISYGSLTADRVPCPPMSGKSYYNPNCNRGGRANPYKRGCSTITRCRRDVS